MIEIKNLTQVYPSGKGIFDINITIKKGEVFGYLGPNGSGKTTTIRGILGQMNTLSGEVLIDGLNARSETEKINVILGYLPGEIAFFDHYTGRQFLNFISDMRKNKDHTLRDQLISKFELEIDVLIKKMSKGMKQKLGIVAAFMHDPEVLILDEPTSGLDPLMQNVFLDLIKEEKRRGKTILMSSHIFEEVEKVCDRVGIIKEGRIIAIEDFQHMDKKIEDLYTITLKAENDDILKSGLSITKVGKDQYLLSVKNNYKEVLRKLSQFDVIHIQTNKQSIEDIFMKYYGGETHD